MISVILIILAAIFNSVMDRVENENFFRSVFKNLDQKFYYKRESWKHAKQIFGYKLDCWHIAKSLMIVCLALAVVFYSPIFNWWVDFLLFGILWNATFNIFYSRLLKSK